MANQLRQGHPNVLAWRPRRSSTTVWAGGDAIIINILLIFVAQHRVRSVGRIMGEPAKGSAATLEIPTCDITWMALKSNVFSGMTARFDRHTVPLGFTLILGQVLGKKQVDFRVWRRILILLIILLDFSWYKAADGMNALY